MENQQQSDVRKERTIFPKISAKILKTSTAALRESHTLRGWLQPRAHLRLVVLGANDVAEAVDRLTKVGCANRLKEHSKARSDARTQTVRGLQLDNLLQSFDDLLRVRLHVRLHASAKH